VIFVEDFYCLLTLALCRSLLRIPALATLGLLPSRGEGMDFRMRVRVCERWRRKEQWNGLSLLPGHKLAVLAPLTLGEGMDLKAHRRTLAIKDDSGCPFSLREKVGMRGANVKVLWQ
jgi:hypothetical protein